MEKKTPQQILEAAHRAALTIATARADLSDPEQELVYDKVFVGLLENSIHTMSDSELLDVLAR
ncbi:MAG TPA: hypothetical protein VJU59_06655 [Paraburkholderia sp.]|uniref:hypothetical protein n=1 Tax=Paraburkholderia sp. TaxID=1926495 RepID=UPI002B473B98|nr:hypothetical protein [Paraburkholderia sp.]HKR39356.1 hypothetical protein [Paraburkholderia sp.]